MGFFQDFVADGSLHLILSRDSYFKGPGMVNLPMQADVTKKRTIKILRRCNVARPWSSLRQGRSWNPIPDISQLRPFAKSPRVSNSPSSARVTTDCKEV